MIDRIEELTSEIMKKVALHTIVSKKEMRTYISARFRSIQVEAERAERQRIANKAKELGDDFYLRILHS